jgi:hypothetical protein
MDAFGMNFIEYDWYIYSIRNPEPHTIPNHSGSDPIERARMSQNRILFILLYLFHCPDVTFDTFERDRIPSIYAVNKRKLFSSNPRQLKHC